MKINQTTIQPSDFNIRRLLLLLCTALLVILIIGSALFISTDGRDDRTDVNSPDKTISQNISSHTFVYGNWVNKQSQILAYDLSDGNEYLIATLPINIKKVHILSSNELVFISETNTRDHGKSIELYNLQTKQSKTLFNASDNFGIDDYIISPNNEYIALWEVEVNPESGVLLGGKSKIYTAKISDPEQKNLIFDETSSATKPIHYPRAVLNDGTVFMDRFLPNSGAGWAYGMSVSNYEGTRISEIESMQNGSYGTQPALSPDGNMLVFAGYNGINGTAERNGYRVAILEPNTVEILDTRTLSRTQLPNLNTSNTYLHPTFDKLSNMITYGTISTNVDEMGTYIYDMQTNSSSKISKSDESLLISSLDDNQFLVGEVLQQGSIVGNLGRQYSTPYNRVSVQNLSGSDTSRIPLTSPLIQFIGIFPGNIYSQTGTLISDSQTMPNEQTLQLLTMEFKPEIKETRSEQQTNPLPTNPLPRAESPTERPTPADDYEYVKPPPTSTPVPHNLPPILICEDVAFQQCNAKFGPPTTFTEKKQHIEYNQCKSQVITQEHTAGRCEMSPLYLYGPEGLIVKAKIHTPIFHSNAPNKNGEYNITLGKNGEMYIDGSKYQGIDYNYTPALRIIRSPQYGSIVVKADVESTLKEYAKKFGLNDKETRDLIIKGKNAVTSQYAFISFFDHDTSHAILPITFDPQPDVYRNVVFYIENHSTMPKYSVESPKFEKIQRHGITAIEISVYTK